VLAAWRSPNPWPDAEAYLHEYHTTLLRPPITEALDTLRQHEPDDRRTGAHQVILDLVRQAGTITHPGQPRYQPTPTGSLIDTPTPETDPPQPLPQPLAFPYLTPTPTRTHRNA